MVVHCRILTVFLVALGQIMQNILRWDHFVRFFTNENIILLKNVCITIKQDPKSTSFSLKVNIEYR